MNSVALPIFLGVFILLLGIANMKGNISSVHWYHRRRVTEENRLPFGRKIGLGTVIIGVSLILFSVLSHTAGKLKISILSAAGSAVLIIGLIVGLALSFYAMIKYNKGIF